jgi:mono/diheme cytochrome c family protein
MTRARVLPAICAVLLASLAVGPPLVAQQARVAQHPAASDSIVVPDEMQPDTLPALPAGMTITMLQAGDSLFHGRGGCFGCHGIEGQGLPAAGDALSVGLDYVAYNWRSIDSLISSGIPDALTRSPIAMPGRGARGDLTAEEIRRVAAYVWAISQTHGEPWPGGHASHAGMVPVGSTSGTVPFAGGPLRSTRDSAGRRQAASP